MGVVPQHMAWDNKPPSFICSVSFYLDLHNAIYFYY